MAIYKSSETALSSASRISLFQPRNTLFCFHLLSLLSLQQIAAPIYPSVRKSEFDTVEIFVYLSTPSHGGTVEPGVVELASEIFLIFSSMVLAGKSRGYRAYRPGLARAELEGEHGRER